MHHRHAHLQTGLLAGALAGLAGTYVMTQLQPTLKQWAEDATNRALGGNPTGGEGEEKEPEGSENEPSTARLATAVARPVLKRPLTKQEKTTGSYIAHYAFGTTMGAVYGAVAELFPGITKFLGIPAGLFLFVTADEGAVPAAGLSKPPQEMPASTHLYGLASHAVYGLVTEMSRKVLRLIL